MPSIEVVKQIPLQDILLATNRFAKENFIGEGGFGPVYKGISKKHGCIAVKRLVHRQSHHAQGDHEFKTEIAMLSIFKHENIVSLLGFCDEADEKILVYKYESNGSLNKHLNNGELTWIQRLWICLDAACALKYLHDNVGSQLGIFHRDVKSSNILLDENWKGKISDFGLSRVRPANMQASFLFSTPCGTPGYIDPDYHNYGFLTQKSDVYSFGVVLWEVLCGRPTVVTSYNDERQRLTVLAKRHYLRKTLHSIIPYYLYKEINTDSLLKFSNIAYQCLKNVEERPTMKQVVEELQEAIHIQLEVRKPENGNSKEKEAKPATRDENKGDESKDPSPPMPQEFVSREGVENVLKNRKINKVIVKGEKAEPMKVLGRVKNESQEKVKVRSSEQGDPPKLDKKKDEEVKKQKGKKAVEETKPAAEHEKKGKELKDPQPPRRLQEFVLSVFLHCQGCAEKIQRRLKGFEGIEKVYIDHKIDKVVVKGKNVDPLKVLERVQTKIKKEVELLSPVPKPLMGESEKPEQEEPPKHEEKNDELLPSVITVVLKVPMHCQDCARKIRKCIQNMKGVENAVPDLENSQIVVKGTFSAAELVDYVHKKTGKKPVIVEQDPIPKQRKPKALRTSTKGNDDGNTTTSDG